MWTRFMDMYSGGGQKLDWSYIYIEAPMQEAEIIFFTRFGRNPNRVTCTCCGADYVMYEDVDLAQLTGYDRQCKREDGKYIEEGNGHWGYQTLEEYIKREDIKVIPTEDIKDSERYGDLPQEGYVWQ